MTITRRLVFAQLLIAAIAARAESASAESISYTYDALGRVTSVTYASGETVFYTYDAAGNRTQVQQTPPTGTFGASPGSISPGGSSTLSWTSAYATSADIDPGIGGVTPVAGGTHVVSPSTTTTYTLRLTGAGGETTKQATVTVVYPAPTGTFSASPTTINPGGSSTLTWTSSDATSASIDNGVGPVTPVSGGSVSVSPSSTTTYTLTLTGAGGTTTKQATVTVTGFNQTIAITGTGPVNLRTLANTAGYSGAQNANVTFTLASGVTINGGGGASSGDAGGIAIDTGTWPTGSYTITLNLQITGNVYGGGGAGAAGNSHAGGAGGDAIYCRLPMSITVNSGGVVKGGGGGGGGGKDSGAPLHKFGGGGGGGGTPSGAGGDAGTGTTSDGNAGSGGTTSAGGAGGSGGGAGATAGGGGGAFATAGGAGVSSGGAGGAAGYAVRKNGNSVSVSNSGTITGTVG